MELFTCDDSRTIKITEICNGYPDCDGGEDEFDCKIDENDVGDSSIEEFIEEESSLQCPFDAVCLDGSICSAINGECACEDGTPCMMIYYNVEGENYEDDDYEDDYSDDYSDGYEEGEDFGFEDGSGEEEWFKK